jgi:hypothetical protein
MFLLPLHWLSLEAGFLDGKAGQTALEFRERHVHGDWGELDEEDRKENQLSLKRGFRLLTATDRVDR